MGHKKEELAGIVVPASSFSVGLIYGADDAPANQNFWI
jgi:hypothetical protein